MKKFLPYILIFVLFIGLFSPLDVANAATIGQAIWSGFINSLSTILAYIFYLLLGIVSLVLMLAGKLLDFVLQYTILDWKVNLIGDGTDMVPGLTGINIAWKMIKDLMNIAFIFILVYEGIKLIIGIGTRQAAKNFIFGVVLASVLINFSLFFTKILIDASNIFTVGIYNSIIVDASYNLNLPPDPTKPPPPTGSGTVYKIGGMSYPFMQRLGLTSLFSANTFTNLTNQTGGMINAMMLPLLGIVLFLIVSFVFLAAAAMFAVRYITLIILLVLSPVAYMGLALPGMRSQANQWWESLNGQLIFAPLFMIMIRLVLVLMGSKGFISGANWGDLIAGTDTASDYRQSSIGLVFNFAMIVGLVIAALVVSKSTAKKGSAYIGQLTSRVTSFTGGAIMGGTARLGRGTLGRYGNNIANDEDLKNRAARGDIGARLKLSAGNRMAQSSFDTRSSDSFKSLSDTTGFGKDGFGKVDAKKENFRAIQDERDKQRVKSAEIYKVSDRASDEAKERLRSVEFKAQEENAKRARQEFLNSDAYRESQEFKDREKLRLERTAFASAERNLASLKQTLENEDPGTREYYRIESQISQAEQQNLQKKKSLEDIQKMVSKYENDNMDNWMSKERMDLIAKSGGTTKEKNGVIKDSVGNILGNATAKTGMYEEIKSSYQQRLDAEASSVENRGALWRYTANTVGLATNLANITTQPMTKKDRKDLAAKIRKAGGGKSNKDKILDALKEETIKDEPEIPATPTTPTEPPATPPGGTPTT